MHLKDTKHKNKIIKVRESIFETINKIVKFSLVEMLRLDPKKKKKVCYW
jgi:hypothetical protein